MGLKDLLAIWQPLAIAAAVGLATGTGGTWWLRDQMAANAKLDAARKDTRAAVRVIAKTDKAARVTESVGAKVEAQQVRTRIIYRDILKEVPVYVTAETDRRFPLSAGFVSVLDRAADGSEAAVADGSGGDFDRASEVAPSDAAGTLVDWAGAYYACRTQVSGLLDWNEQQRKLWESK